MLGTRDQYRLTFKRLRINWAWQQQTIARDHESVIPSHPPRLTVDLPYIRYILPKTVWLQATIKVALQGVLSSLPERDKGPSSASLAQVTLRPPRRKSLFCFYEWPSFVFPRLTTAPSCLEAASARLGLPGTLRRDWIPHISISQTTMASFGEQELWIVNAMRRQPAASSGMQTVGLDVFQRYALHGQRRMMCSADVAFACRAG